MTLKNYDDKDKLLKLIDDFCEIESIEELTAIVYVIWYRNRDAFSYEESDFEDFSSIGPVSRKLFEDLFQLEVREECVKRSSTMSLTLKGKEKVRRVSDVSFCDVRDLLCSVDRNLWPMLVAFLYLRRKFGAQQAEKILKEGYDIDEHSWKTLRALVNRLAS